MPTTPTYMIQAIIEPAHCPRLEAGEIQAPAHPTPAGVASSWVRPMNKVLLLGLACTGWLAVAAENALTVRVLPTRGGPQIHVDGKPIAPRFFWGAMNGGSLRLGEEWADQSFEFCPGIDVQQQGTLHFRFGSLAGKIDLADVRVRDAQTGEDILPVNSFAKPEVFTPTWNTWPPPPANRSRHCRHRAIRSQPPICRRRYPRIAPCGSHAPGRWTTAGWF